MSEMQQQVFERLFGLDEESRAKMAAYLREMGFSEAEIAEHKSSVIRGGQSFVRCRLGDVGRLVDRLLFRQCAGFVLLKISRLPFDQVGHLDIQVLEVGPPAPGSGPSGLEIVDTG